MKRRRATIKVTGDRDNTVSGFSRVISGRAHDKRNVHIYLVVNYA